MTSQQQQVIEYFNQTHKDYRWFWGIDRHLGLHCGFTDPVHQRHDEAVTHMNRVLATLAEITRADRVLDAGCGIGGSVIWLAENLGCQVTGVNLNARQVELAEHLARRHQVGERVQFHVADFSATGLAAESFDVVWALESMCYAEDKGAFLAEVYRLLKPGGRLIIADAFLTKEELTSDERRIVERWRQGWAISSVLSIRQFQQRLEKADFQRLSFRDITAHVTPSSRRIYRASLLLYPLGWLLHRIGLRSEVQTRGIASGYYQYQARKRGLGVYGIFQAEK
jgi:cyclopropane fatty-acyl-phospholipid synthase-like methyltransferase